MTAHPFDLDGPLPKGRVRIEASAGTGKTYTVAHLVVRYVVEEDLPVGGVLVTTFTKAAAAELRERCRARLKDESAHVDPARADRARRAVAEFDHAIMDTIHSVCQRLLRLAGRPARLEDRPGRSEALIAEVVNDWLVRHRKDARIPIEDKPRKRLVPAVRKALAFPNARIVTHAGNAADNAAANAQGDLLRQMVEDCVRDVRERSRDAVSFDGLLYAAREVVTAPGGEAVCERLRRRFPVAIVDEAQDTDPVQWEIMDALYPADRSDLTLIMVGDPKQSIYGFRGADVRAFTNAGGRRFTLTDNHRSDQPLLDGLNALLRNATFGGGIDYLQVQAPRDKHQQSRLPAGIPVPLELVVAETDAKQMGSAAANPIAEAAAARVAHALAAGKAGNPAERFWDPRQVAVLVGTREEGKDVAHALRRRGIPCTTAGTTSVMESEGARQLRALLGALAHPARQQHARLAAIGWFGHLDMRDLAAVTDDDLLRLQEQLLQWGAQMRRHGVAAVIRERLASASVLERLGADEDLPRHLTDVDHLAELLHERTGRGGCTPEQAVVALAELDQLDASNELVTRRLDTDAPVVQVTTIHAAKGLQWPCVVVARKWGTKPLPAKDPPVVRRNPADADPELCVDWITEKTLDAVKESVETEWFEEQKRLFYVAVTRAESRLVVVLPADRADATYRSIPGELLLGDRGRITSADALRDALGEGLGPRVDDGVSFTSLANVIKEEPALDPTPPADVPLDVAPLPPGMRRVPREWSFTSISARGAHEVEPVGAAEQGGLDEHGASDAVTADVEESDAATARAPDPAAAPAPGPLADLPASAEVGVCLHAVFERVDFTAPDLAAELRPLLARHAAVPALRDRHDALAGGLARVIDTPLGAGVPGNPALRQLARPHRLDELRFQLALAPHGRGASVRTLGALWADALSPADPLHPYALTLADGALMAWPAGYLVGAIDLVARLAPDHHVLDTPRYLVIDYKSNRLRGGYHHAALTHAMMAHHYPLQGLLYLVAVHRFLRWRTGVADPSAQLAGFAYLFVRGMLGPDTPVDAAGRVPGVFHWAPPAGLVAAASALLANGAAQEVA
ncbi:MAG: UvrD-helicase domain-containing protein [Gemmatimonadetes bacterium]|nr:UvrD-helicase domain-containing protein [Gemmatimonadota bacterium]